MPFFVRGRYTSLGGEGDVEVVAFWGWSPLRFWGWDGGGIVTFRGLVVAYCGVGGQVFFWSLRFFCGEGGRYYFRSFFLGCGAVESHYFRDFILLFARYDGSWFVSKLTVVSYCSY